MKDKLIAIRDIVSKGWCQGAAARAQGVAVKMENPEATHFCLVSACIKGCHSIVIRQQIYQLIEKETGKRPIVYNDSAKTKREDVLEMLDNLIERED